MFLVSWQVVCSRGLNALLNASGDFSGWHGVWAFERAFNL